MFLVSKDDENRNQISSDSINNEQEEEKQTEQV